MTRNRLRVTGVSSGALRVSHGNLKLENILNINCFCQVLSAKPQCFGVQKETALIRELGLGEWRGRMKGMEGHEEN